MPGDRKFERGQIGKHFLAVLAQLAKFGVGKLAVIVVRALPCCENIHHFLRAQRHHRPKDNAVNESKNGRVNSDGQSKSDQGDEGETRRLDELPERETKILDHAVCLSFEMRKAAGLDSKCGGNFASRQLRQKGALSHWKRERFFRISRALCGLNLRGK